MLHEEVAFTYTSPNDNNCVPTALAILTGETGEVWLQRLRAIEPKSCTKHRGSSGLVYTMAAARAGWRLTPINWSRWNTRFIPLHVALARLQGRKALLVIRSGGFGTHAIAAEGFMVADNGTPRARWWGDWLSTWERTWTRYGGFRKSRVRAQVQTIYLIEKIVVDA